ncbi:MAG: hypothetical protein IPL55_01045 [Saprospiraceae bacterium]|nr:hypothetical protein [Saprospiraceae bacterium]MBL0025655.1 hypothetical protein [Saprospiraceae bacterium]
MLRICILFILLSSNIVQSQRINDKKAKEIIAECIKVHGGKNYKKFDISFEFRQYQFRIKNNNGHFYYERTYKDSIGNNLKDVLDNNKFYHEVNGKKMQLTEKMESRNKEGLNSVVYFILLPYKLLDPAVNVEYVGTSELEGQKYDQVKVWFEPEGGGIDFEDVYCYWINQNTHMLDYLAYTNGGPRFRKATKQESIHGITFQNYDNYQILDKSIPSDQYDAAFIDGKFKLLSKIEQINYKENE